VGRSLNIFVFLVLGGALQLSADEIDLGYLSLTGPNFGYQTVGFYNLTGATDGCEQLAAQYNVCNAVNVTSWQLTIDFAPSTGATGLPASPLVFNSNGNSNDIGPTDASFDAYTGAAGNPWNLSFDLQNPATGGCPPCDAQISEIILTGTIDQTSLNLYNGSITGPYITDSLSTQSFSSTWFVPASDYTQSPDSIFDTNDVLFDNQAPAPTVPEPRSFYLILMAAAAVGLFKRHIRV
jgi:hypothetical protein